MNSCIGVLEIPKTLFKKETTGSRVFFKSHKILPGVLGGSSLVYLLFTSFLGFPEFSLNANPSLSDTLE